MAKESTAMSLVETDDRGALAERPERERTPAEVPRETAETGEVHRALARAQMRFNAVIKQRKAEAGTKGRYTYANLADVCRETLPQLHEEGVFPSWRIAGTRVFFRLTHAESGQWIESDLQIVAPDARGGVQALGSALSYIRRYLYVMMLGIVPIDDPDDDGGASMMAGRMSEKLVRFVLDCAEGMPSGEAPERPLGRSDLIVAMRTSREPAGVQEAALRLYDERARRPTDAQRAAAIDRGVDPDADGR